MLCGWEGNRRSGVTLAMLHRNQWFIHLRAHGLSKADEHPAYTHRGYGILYVLMLAASGGKRLCVGLVSVRCLSVCLSRRSIVAKAANICRRCFFLLSATLLNRKDKPHCMYLFIYRFFRRFRPVSLLFVVYVRITSVNLSPRRL